MGHGEEIYAIRRFMQDKNFNKKHTSIGLCNSYNSCNLNVYIFVILYILSIACFDLPVKFNDENDKSVYKCSHFSEHCTFLLFICSGCL